MLFAPYVHFRMFSIVRITVWQPTNYFVLIPDCMFVFRASDFGVGVSFWLRHFQIIANIYLSIKSITKVFQLTSCELCFIHVDFCT